jgi:hypothetical protein
LIDEIDLSAQVTSNRLLTDYFRCPSAFGAFEVSGDLSVDSGFFRFGSAGICYGQCSSGPPAESVTDRLHDCSPHVRTTGHSVQLPFDPVQIVENLHRERYRSNTALVRQELDSSKLTRRLYYLARPLLPIAVRKHLQRIYFRDWETIPFPTWPLDCSVENILQELLILSMKSRNVKRVPFIWFWPEGAGSCAAVTHDVETTSGRDFCSDLMDLNDSFGIKSAFQVVPEKRYSVPQSLLDSIVDRGFELNVHDLNHDGHLMERREEFLRRAKQINIYGRKFGAQGFRSAMLHRNLDWYDVLDFSYDMSVPNVAHLDPQRGGCCTVFPFFNGKLVELPVTLTQDYTLFHILKDYSTDLWMKQIGMIRQMHGLIQVIVHPDYIIDKAARQVYAGLLGHLSNLRARGDTWIALPKEVAVWWRQRSKLRLVSEGGTFRIDGEGSQRARIAYAKVEDGKLSYDFGEEPGDLEDMSGYSSDRKSKMDAFEQLQTGVDGGRHGVL